MEIMNNYSDLLTEIEIIKDQINLTEKDLEYWFGEEIPFDSKGCEKFGIDTALEQTEKMRRSLNKLYTRLEYHEQTKERLERLFNRFEDVDYKIAFKRIVEIKTHQQIADELGYTHDYIREKWAKLKRKTHNEPTETLV